MLQPVTSGLLSLLLLNEGMSAREVGGGALVCGALLLCCASSLREERYRLSANQERLADERVVAHLAAREQRRQTRSAAHVARLLHPEEETTEVAAEEVEAEPKV